MNKLLVTIQIPTIEQSFDLFIPINKKVGTVKKYIVKAIDDITSGLMVEKESYALFDVDTGKKYPNNIYVKDSGIKNGARLMLI